MLGRIIGSLLAIGLYETAVILATPRLLIAAGQADGGRFDSTDTSYIATWVHMGPHGKPGVAAAVLLSAVLLLIWWGPIRRRLGAGRLRQDRP